MVDSRSSPGPKSRTVTRTPCDSSLPVTDQQLSRSIDDSIHRFDCVDDQIENHLLQLDSIPYNERHVI